MTAGKIALVILCFGALWITLSLTGLVCGAANDASNVVRKEFYPSALLKKYEWFKDAAAALDEKIATISTYEARNKQTKDEYGKPSSWPRDVREQNAIWQSELAGIKASYNLLAADYNSQMVKFNWRFCNVGDVPEGGTALPREYKPYITQ